MKYFASFLFIVLSLSSWGQRPGFVMYNPTNNAIVVPVSLWDSNRLAILASLDLDVSINSGVPNGTGALVHWSQLLGVPAGFADGSDDGSGGGGGGTNFISSVSTDFQVLVGALSLTNYTGTGAFVRASSLSSYQPLDADLTDLADGSLSGSKVGTGISGDNITTGTIADARVASTIARDSEVAAGYQPLDADLTTLATLDGASLTNLNGSEIASGTVASARIDPAIPRLGNIQTFLGASNIFSSDLYVGGTLNAATQNVDRLVIGQVDLGTNIIAVVNGGTGATNAAGARANLGTDNGSNITSGTVADARIDSAIARDSEVAAAYQPLDADLTAMAAGTAVATAQTNAVSVGAPVLYVGTTNVAAAIAGISGGSGDVSSTGNNTLSGTNTFSGPAWIKPNRKRVVLFEKDWMALTSGNVGYPEFNGTAVASGTATIIAGETNHPGLMRITSSSSANSGYYYVSSTSGLFAEPLLTWESISRVRGTNAGISSTHGFTDSVNSSNPTDAIRMWRSNNFLIPQIWNNGSLVQGYEYPVSSNQFLYIKVQVQTNMTDVSFYAEDSDTKTLVVSTNLTGTIPASSSRVFGMGHFAFFTNAVAISIEDLDWSTAYIATPVDR